MKYRVDYTLVVERQCWAYIEADSEEEAIELVKDCDDSVDFCDSENFSEDTIDAKDYQAEEDEE